MPVPAKSDAEALEAIVALYEKLSEAGKREVLQRLASAKEVTE